jgi:hypothetical protein
MVGDFVNQGGMGEPLNTVSAIGEMRVRFPISETDYLRFESAQVKMETKKEK